MSDSAGRAPVLVVEDYEPVAELERRALVRSGAAVRVVGRIGNALQLLKQEPFSAVLLDYQLPDGDPWAVVELARSRTPRIPVIVVTAMGSERVAADALHRGVVEYVRKVGTFYEDLPQVVARAVKLAQAEERLRRSDALLHMINLHANDVIGTADANDVITSISCACRELLGYEPEELIGTRGLDLVHPEDRAGLAAGARDPQAVRAVRYRRKDGTYTWVELSFHVARDPATGAPVDAVAIARGIAERRKAEEATRALEAMLDAMPDLVLRLSADGTLLDYRAHPRSGLSPPPEKLAGANVREMLPPALAEECLRHVRAALETRSAQRWEYQLPASGGPRDHEARLVPGGPGEVLAIIRIR